MKVTIKSRSGDFELEVDKDELVGDLLKKARERHPRPGWATGVQVKLANKPEDLAESERRTLQEVGISQGATLKLAYYKQVSPEEGRELRFGGVEPGSKAALLISKVAEDPCGEVGTALAVARAGAAPGGSELSRDYRADVSMPKRSARSGDPAEDAEASRRQAPRKKARRRLPIDIRGRGAGAMARKRRMWQCLVLGCLCTQLYSLDFLGARQLPRRLGALFLATVVLGPGHDAQAARLVRDKGEAVLDPKTGQKAVPPCEKVCNKECLAIVGQVNEKNVAYCQKRCQDDCAAGDGFGATETFIDADMPRVSKDSEKSPVERFAEWGAEANVQMMEFMKPPGAAPDLQPDSLSAGDDVPAASRAEIAKPLLDARQLLKPK
ncbi:unnamed protein product [Effrenium voratum]|nr:unnamed protein product [Effrenium voratum]